MLNDKHSEPTPVQIYEIVRSKYTHEDLWIQQRVGWLLTANGFLFAGYGTLFGLSYNKTSGDLAAVIWKSLHVISWVGVGLAFLVGFGSFGAYFAKQGAKEEWSKLVSDEVRQHFPRIDAAARFKWLGSLTSGALCTFIFFIWLYIITFVLPR
jgi:hypothetical protein